jgi:hypothetical protein
MAAAGAKRSFTSKKHLASRSLAVIQRGQNETKHARVFGHFDYRFPAQFHIPLSGRYVIWRKRQRADFGRFSAGRAGFSATRTAACFAAQGQQITAAQFS